MIGAEGLHAFRTLAVEPMILESVAAIEQISDGLTDRLDDVRSAGERSAWPEIRLAALHPIADRVDRHPRFGTGAHRFIHRLRGTFRGEATRESPFVRVHFANAHAEDRTAHRIEQ